ncbi:hypothetical protein EVJ58_g3185 [Rhodofomes roseus]|uniref:Uncharacterized protein n=1 Tax=Rhodofomes roseus TaxID=34475 RepID=A0A4Y9YM07_9APHY|nr:hypothetical protein EVJ58_g3185 [Rhodofomes roseus]
MSSPAQSPLPLDLPSEEYAMSLDSDSEGFVSRDNMDVEVQDRCLSGMVLPSLSRIADNLTSAKVSDAEPPEEESMSEEDSMSEDNVSAAGSPMASHIDLKDFKYTDSDADENNPASQLQSLGGIPVTDTQEFPPVYNVEDGSTGSSLSPNSNFSSCVSSELELPDIAVNINPLQHIFGHLLDDPRWPYIPALDKTVKATLEDWITLCHCIRRDLYTFRLWSFTYDLQKQTIHMSSPTPLHNFLVSNLNQVLWAAAKAGLIKVGTWTPLVFVMNPAQDWKGPIGSPSVVDGPSVVDDHDPHANADPLADIDPHADADPRAESSGASGAKSSALVQVPLFPLSHVPDAMITLIFPSGSTVNIVTTEIARHEKADHHSFCLVEYMRAPVTNPWGIRPLLVFVKVDEQKKYSAPKYSDYVKKCAKESVAANTEKEWAQGWIKTYNKICRHEMRFDKGDNPGPTRDQQPWLSPQYLIDGHIFIHRQRAWLTCSDLSVPAHVEELEQLSRSDAARTPASWEKIGLGMAIQDSYDSEKTASRRNLFEIRWSAALQSLSQRVFNVCSTALISAIKDGPSAFMAKYGIRTEEFDDVLEQSKQGPDVMGEEVLLNKVLEELRQTVRMGSIPTATARLKNFAYELAFLHALGPPLENAQYAPDAPVQQPPETGNHKSVIRAAVVSEHAAKKQRID